jgi:superfamily I DNA/RNA helicase
MVKLSVPETSHAFVRQLVSLAKQYAFGFLTPAEDLGSWFRVVEHFSLDELLEETESGVAVEEAIEHARTVLAASVAADKEVIDFDDMIYAPLIHNARVWQNDWVLIDEAQDTNPARRALAKKMLRAGGRLIAVGDPHQAIYGFTGADADSLDIIRREFAAVVLPLTVTYRCPKSVVDVARQWVSHITAHESAPDGSVSSCTSQEFEKKELRPSDAILCRNTKPLVQLAYSLIRRGIPCHVEGREIGRGLIALTNKWKARTLDALQEKLETYAQQEVEKLLAKGREQQAAGLQDRVETLIVIIESLPHGSTINTLREYISQLFDDSEPSAVQRRVVLSTVHKAKGREWDRVWLLGRNRYMPSPYARQDWQVEQEVNLMYVAVTRAKQELIDVVVPTKG